VEISPEKKYVDRIIFKIFIEAILSFVEKTYALCISGISLVFAKLSNYGI